jgi:hypothetical protein
LLKPIHTFRFLLLLFAICSALNSHAQDLTFDQVKNRIYTQLEELYSPSLVSYFPTVPEMSAREMVALGITEKVTLHPQSKISSQELESYRIWIEFSHPRWIHPEEALSISLLADKDLQITQVLDTFRIPDFAIQNTECPWKSEEEISAHAKDLPFEEAPGKTYVNFQFDRKLKRYTWVVSKIYETPETCYIETFWLQPSTTEIMQYRKQPYRNGCPIF